jgi:hypothetical protein
MDKLSQDDLNRLLSPESKPNPKAASMEEGSKPRFRRFAGLYSKDIAADPACSLSQDEVDQAFAERGLATSSL